MAENLTSKDDPFLSGQLLIAMPGMKDERFAKTVIYMCAHTPEGAMGLVLNQALDTLTFPDLLEQLGIEGPVDEDDILDGETRQHGGRDPKAVSVLFKSEWRPISEFDGDFVERFSLTAQARPKAREIHEPLFSDGTTPALPRTL